MFLLVELIIVLYRPKLEAVTKV